MGTATCSAGHSNPRHVLLGGAPLRSITILHEENRKDLGVSRTVRGGAIPNEIFFSPPTPPENGDTAS